MKILHLAPEGNNCGIATYTTNLITHFTSSKAHERYVIPPKPDLAWLTKEEVLGFFEEFIEYAEGYDVIHLQSEYGLYNGPGPTSFGLKVFLKILEGLRALGKKVFVTFHSEPVFLKALGLFNWENKKCARIWEKIGKLFTKENNLTAITHTDISTNKFIRSGFKNAVTITHGVIERKFSKSTHLPKKSDSVVLSIFGFIAPYKGYEFALAIMDLLPENFKLCIIGGRHPASDAEEIGELLKWVTERGMLSRIMITGWVTPDEADFYQQNSDVCLAPYQTRELSASGAITWSLTSKRPVIASNINSFRDINKVDQCMVLCHPTDRLEWVWAIKKVVEDQGLRDRLVRNADNYCEKNSWTNICKEHMEVYKK